MINFGIQHSVFEIQRKYRITNSELRISNVKHQTPKTIENEIPFRVQKPRSGGAVHQ
jgi:hypothetical protein